MMKKCDLNEKPDDLFNFFPTIHDAVHNAKEKLVPISVITDIPSELTSHNGVNIVSAPDISNQ